MIDKNFLLIIDVIIAFSLCYLIIRFIGMAFYGRNDAASQRGSKASMSIGMLFRRFTKALFGISGDEFLIREDKNAFLGTKKQNGEGWLPDLTDLLRIGIVVAIATGIGWIVDRLIASEAAVISVYMLAVLLVSLGARRKLTGPIASVLCLLIYDFLFIQPRFIFVTYGREYSFIFILMCIVSVLAGTLTQRLKANVRQASEAAYRSRLLFETNQLMQRASSRQEIFDALAVQLRKLLSSTVIIYPVAEDMDDETKKGQQGRRASMKLGEPHIYPISEKIVGDTGALSAKERDAALWALRHNGISGHDTEIYPEALCTYLPISVDDKVYGVAAVLNEGQPYDLDDDGVLFSVLGECALALENNENQRRKEAADVMARSEQLRANLLRTISHDLRTPLTSIYGNASNLISNEAVLDTDTKKQMYEDIYDDAVWLNGLVENLLYMTRIEERRMDLDIKDELVDEVVDEAVKRLDRKAAGHYINIVSSDDFIFARMDARLIVQVLINLLTNAVKYTPEGSHITVRTEKKDGKVVLSVEDDGPGIADSEKPRVFDMFYSAGDRSSHGARSTGLGLYLCRAIINAHGSEIRLRDNVPHGSVFSFELPMGEVDIHG